MVMAIVYTLTGENDKAIDELETLLSIESQVSPRFLQADPIFAPLRDLPRFKQLMKKYAYINKGS